MQLPDDRGSAMEFHQIRSFLAVVRHLNFTRAAAELRVAQPSLTRAILKLEAELEGPLFRRERSSTHLTDLGRMMLPHLQATFAAAESAKSEARRLRSGQGGRLCLGVCAGIDPSLPAALVVDMLAQRPDLDLSVEVASTDLVERRLMAGDFDAAILAPIGVCNARFDVREIHDDDFVVAFAEAHRFAGQRALPIEALDAEPLVVRLDCRHEEALAALMETRGVKRLVRHRIDDSGWLADLVRKGLGCAIVPNLLARSHVLPFRPLDDVPLRHRTTLTTVAGRRHSTALASLIGRTPAAARP